MLWSPLRLCPHTTHSHTRHPRPMMGFPPFDVLLLRECFFPVAACAFLISFVLPLCAGAFPRSLSYFFGALFALVLNCVVDQEVDLESDRGFDWASWAARVVFAVYLLALSSVRVPP